MWFSRFVVVSIFSFIVFFETQGVENRQVFFDNPVIKLTVADLTKMINSSLSEGSSLTENKVADILIMQQIQAHRGIKDIIEKLDVDGGFNEDCLKKFGRCIWDFYGFIFAKVNKNLLNRIIEEERIRKEELQAKLYMAHIHNIWGNKAKHDHRRSNPPPRNPVSICSPIASDVFTEQQHLIVRKKKINPWKNSIRERNLKLKQPVLASKEADSIIASIQGAFSSDKEKEAANFVDSKAQVQPSTEKGKEANPKSKESSSTIIQHFINKEYDRDLVTKFIEACPCTQERLVDCTGISRGTISKLKSPQTYGPLNPSAQRFWRWLQLHTVDSLKKELGLSNQDVERMAQNLSKFPVTASLVQHPSTSVAEPKSQGQSSAKKEREADSKSKESSSTIVQHFINKEYDRDLVTKFIEACPCTQEKLVDCTGISRGTISKLKSPQTYGLLNPSAQCLWRWLQSRTVDALKKELGLSSQEIEKMAQNLSKK